MTAKVAAKPAQSGTTLLAEVRGLIHSARHGTALAIGTTMARVAELSGKPDKLIRPELAALREEDKLTPDLVFRDPYVLDFLGLRDTYAERDLEAAILREIEAFILELGVGFAFLERQKRIMVDGDEHDLDLLFYYRHLRRLVAIDLKLREFKPANKG